MSASEAIEATEMRVGAQAAVIAFHASFETERAAWRAAQDYLAKYPPAEYGTSLHFAIGGSAEVQRFEVIGSRTSGLSRIQRAAG